MNAPAVRLQPHFIGETNELFVMQYLPESEVRGHIIYVPPFAEEMNRCRAAVALQSRRFAAVGYLCTVLDFYGTGESLGDLGDADADTWLKNIEVAADAADIPSTAPVALWGCRLGALLALHAADRVIDVDKCLLWQPCIAGKSYLTQFLRQRSAALVAQGLPGENTAAIRERLLQGETIEVAGYPLSKRLVESLDQLDLSSLRNSENLNVIWMENVSDVDAPLTPRVSNDTNRLQGSGAAVKIIPFTGNPVWQLHERADFSGLINNTPLEII